MSTPHEFDLSRFLAPGKHILTLRVDNSIDIDVGKNSHSISDHTQGNWNGVVGEIKLVASDPVWIDDLQIFPKPRQNPVLLKGQLGNKTDKLAEASVNFHISGPDGAMAGTQSIDFSLDPGKQTFETEIPLRGDIRRWGEFDPALYLLVAKLESDHNHLDMVKHRFGMREVATKGTQFTINGRPIFLRGTLECAIFPKTGHPPTSVDEWNRIIRICKNHGLNHIRFHSWCPPEAAFVAADKLGFYLEVESGSWANFGATVGDGRPLDDWLYREAHRITKAYANHPSFVFMAYGNEPSGDGMKAYLADWCTYWKKAEPRALHTGGAGWSLLAESDYHITHKGTRIQHWGAELNSIINAKAPQTRFDFAEFLKKHDDKPTISHEIGQWCAFPNFEEIAKYTGPLKARNFEIFRDFLDQAGMGHQAKDFLMASGKLQALCYKHDIEASLRTRGFGGFQLLDLHDFPGQGTALVGILDAFWDSKGYVTPEDHRQYCSPTVPLARLDQMVWTNEENLKAEIEIAHFCPQDLKQAVVYWKLHSADGSFVRDGNFPPLDLPTVRNSEVGEIDLALAENETACKLILEVGIIDTTTKNHWDLWCYPAHQETNASPKLRLTREFDKKTLTFLMNGGDVLWSIPPGRVRTDVKLGFSSIFWNTAWTKGHAPHTMGILCEPTHPALKHFPTDYHSNWQWWEIVTNAATMDLDQLPNELEPLIQVVPDWFKPERLALAFEAKVGKDRILVTSVDMQEALQERPVARQLLHSLKEYAASPNFQPSTLLTAEQLRQLVQP